MPTDPGYAGAARHQAQQILSQPPYTHAPSSSPRPLAGLLHAVGRGLEAVFGPIGRWFLRYLLRPIGSGLHGVFGTWTLEVVVAAAVVLGVLVAVSLVRRRARISARRVERRQAAVGTDPAAIEAEADRRAALGDFAGALRLRFQAGLLRLEAAGLVAHQQTATDSQMAGQLGSPTFARLAERHQAVAYAGVPADADDVRSAETGWPQVPGEVERHRGPVEAGTT